MPLPQAWLDQWISDGTGLLYHRVAFEQLLPWIMRDGLLPRVVTGLDGMYKSMPSRATHNYFATQNSPKLFYGAGMGEGSAHLWVHASKLNPCFLDSDEDKIGAYATSPPIEVQQLPCATSLTWRTSNEPAQAWSAVNAAIVDSPEWVWHSLHHGAVSYRQPVPVSALEFDPSVTQRWKIAPPGMPRELLHADGHPLYQGP